MIATPWSWAAPSAQSAPIPVTLTKYRHEVRAEAGVPTLRFHDLRHIAVSLLLAPGVPPHLVRGIAGHSDITVTMTVHPHGRPDGKAAALTQLSTASGTRCRHPSASGEEDT